MTITVRQALEKLIKVCDGAFKFVDRNWHEHEMGVEDMRDIPSPDGLFIVLREAKEAIASAPVDTFALARFITQKHTHVGPADVGYHAKLYEIKYTLDEYLSQPMVITDIQVSGLPPCQLCNGKNKLTGSTMMMCESCFYVMPTPPIFETKKDTDAIEDGRCPKCLHYYIATDAAISVFTCKKCGFGIQHINSKVKVL